MQYRHVTLPAVPVVVSLALLSAMPAFGQAPAATSAPASRAAASRPLVDLSAIPSDPASIREMIATMRMTDAVAAADAVVKLKFLARRGVPVWDYLDDNDPTSSRQLLTWLRDHPGNIHHPSPLRVQWDAMDLISQEISSGKTWMMGNAELVEYGKLAREMIRDGDPYGYYALLDVCYTATEMVSRGSDQVTFAYVVPYLDRHLDLHLTLETLKNWKGYWAKPITQKRKFLSPISPPESDGTPIPPASPWDIPTRMLLVGLDAYRSRLSDLGLWQDPPWVKQFTARTETADLLKALVSSPFPVRQHIYRLLRQRMGDAQARKLVAQAIADNHPRGQVLQLVLAQTELLPYADAIRRAWPKELAEQCPGTLEDLLSTNPRAQYEAYLVAQDTLVYWPDRERANRWAVGLWRAAGAGTTEFSVLSLMTVDNKEGVDTLLAAYRSEDIPNKAYNSFHRWTNASAKAFRTACADKDLAPVIIKITTATQPVVDTSKQDWSQILRMAYELVWWRLNSDKLVWSEKNNRLEVPQDQLTHPTEQQVLAAYSDRGKLFRDMLEAAKTRKVEFDPRK